MTCVTRVMCMKIPGKVFPEKSNSTFSLCSPVMWLLKCKSTSDYTWDSIMGWTSQNVIFRPKWVHSSHSWAILAFSPRQMRRLVILRTKSWKEDLHNWMWSLSKLQSNFYSCMIKTCFEGAFKWLGNFMRWGARSVCHPSEGFVSIYFTRMLTQCTWSTEWLECI